MTITTTISTTTAKCDSCGKVTSAYWRTMIFHASTDPTKPVDGTVSDMDLCEDCAEPVKAAFRESVAPLLKSVDMKD